MSAEPVTSPPELSERATRLRLAITRTARRLRQQSNPELGPASLSALASVERAGPLTPSELADIERIQRPTATGLLAGLTEKGLISRSPDPSDGRSAIVTVTGEGKALLRDLRKRKNAYLARRMRALSDDDAATLDRAAEILERVLEEEPR